MSIFPKMTLTNKGKALEAKLKIGDTMEFTRMGLGSGELNKPIAELLNLINEKASVSINNKQIIQEYTVQLRAFFTNMDVQERFYWREFGVFANDPDEGEILYAYSNAGDMGGWIPAVTDNRIERMFYTSVQVSNAQEINITIPQSDTFIPTSEKGVADGVASLDSSGKVPESQLPELDFIPNDEKGQPNGVMPLNSDGKADAKYLPQMDFYTKAETLANNTKTLFGLDVSALPDAVFNKIKTLIDSANSNANGKAKFQTGSYIGTGTYGISNSTTLQFDFAPKIIFLIDSRKISYFNGGLQIIPCIVGAYAPLMGYDDSIDGRVFNAVVAFAEKIVKWYSSNAYYQSNDVGVTYKYIVIG